MFEFLNDVANKVGNFFSVDSGVTPQTPMSSPDAIKTGTALSGLGFFGSKGESEFSLPKSVKAFQDANGLKVDGVINPGGPTENAISKALQQKSISTSNPLEASQSELPSHVTVSKPEGSNTDQKSWTASATFGPKPTKPKPSPKAKIDPLTDLVNPLTSAPKGKMPTAKGWEEVAKMQKPKAHTAIIPQGDTVQARLQSIMGHPDYAKKKDPALVKHIQGEFKRAFPGEVQYDETGKMIQQEAVITADQVSAYDPKDELRAQSFKAQSTATQSVNVRNETPAVTLGKGNAQDRSELLERLAHMQANNSGEYGELPDHVKKANAKYWEIMRSTDPRYYKLSPEDKKRIALKASNAEAALSEYGKAIKKGWGEAVTDFAIGVSDFAGKEQDAAESRQIKERLEKENVISPNYRDKTPDTLVKDVLSFAPVLGNVMTASEVQEAVKASGAAQEKSRAAAFGALLAGKFGGKVVKLGASGLSQLSKAVIGKNLTDMTSDEIRQLTKLAAEKGVEDETINQIKQHFKK
ncbi:hypothetical protein [Terasakiella pusilla]|uniref:hypothetical protein n=1 Tax=Terasakiella pusilla TaxID=64973 RepID=UPI003AA8F1FA